MALPCLSTICAYPPNEPSAARTPCTERIGPSNESGTRSAPPASCPPGPFAVNFGMPLTSTATPFSTVENSPSNARFIVSVRM